MFIEMATNFKTGNTDSSYLPTGIVAILLQGVFIIVESFQLVVSN